MDFIGAAQSEWELANIYLSSGEDDYMECLSSDSVQDLFLHQIRNNGRARNKRESFPGRKVCTDVPPYARGSVAVLVLNFLRSSQHSP